MDSRSPAIFVYMRLTNHMRRIPNTNLQHSFIRIFIRAIDQLSLFSRKVNQFYISKKNLLKFSDQ